MPSSPTMTASAAGTTIKITYRARGSLPAALPAQTGILSGRIHMSRAAERKSGTQLRDCFREARRLHSGKLLCRSRRCRIQCLAWFRPMPSGNCDGPIQPPCRRAPLRVANFKWWFRTGRSPEPGRATQLPARAASASKTISIKCNIPVRGPAKAEITPEGCIHSTSASAPVSSLSCTYTSAQNHSLYLGTRLLATGTLISVVVDAGSPLSINLNLGGEDVLIRTLLGQLAPGTHTVTATHVGDAGTDFYFDFSR